VAPRVYDQKEPYNSLKLNFWDKKLRKARSSNRNSPNKIRFADRIFKDSFEIEKPQ
jgi:hypothetical protein